MNELKELLCYISWQTIAKSLKVNRMTIWRWRVGKVKPNLLTKKWIIEELNTQRRNDGK